MKALVTGGRGFIGSHVVDALADAGAEVRVHDASPVNGARPDVEHVVGDILDEAALTRAMAGCDAVFHLAALYTYSPKDADTMLRINVDGTRTLLAAARKAEVPRVVHTSSCSTCGPAAGRLADERDSPPAWELKVAYKRTKVASERVALDAAAAGQDVVVVNPTVPVGPRDRRPTPTGQMVADVASGKIRAFVGTTALNVVDVRDVARGHVLAHERGRAGERYLLGGENLSLGDVFAIAARHAGRPAPRVRVPYGLVFGAAWAAHHAGRAIGREPRLLVLDEVRQARMPAVFSIEKARTELGYSWRSADEALRDAVAALGDGGSPVRARPAVALAVLGLAAAAAPAAAGPTLPLGHAGRWITDAQGRVVVLHGINMVYKRPPYAPDAVGFGDDDAAFLAAEGMDTVRVGIIYKAVEPQPGVYDDAYLDRIADTVATLGRHGIVSLLDFHQDLYNERFQGEGWPDWAVLDDGLPAEPKSGFPANYLVMPALQRAFDNFWANAAGPAGIGLQDRYAAAWRHVAQRFRDNPAVLGYDLMNEPWPGTTWQQCANPAGCPAFDATMTQFIKRTIAAIREADPRTLAFYEPHVLFNDGSDTSVDPGGDPHAAMSFHDYCLQAGQSDTNDGCDTADDLVFTNADKHAAATGSALLLTEFGATRAEDILTAMVERADRFMVGWQEWHYCGCDDPTTAGPGNKQAIVIDPAKPPTGANLDADKLRVLVRPHPESVAGTPKSYGFDAADHRFTLSYTTTRADGTGAFGPTDDTEILLPARQYPNGYATKVVGGTIRSAPGAAVLRVAACPGAGEVAVEVTPTGTSSASCAAPPPSQACSHQHPPATAARPPRRPRRRPVARAHLRALRRRPGSTAGTGRASQPGRRARRHRPSRARGDPPSLPAAGSLQGRRPRRGPQSDPRHAAGRAPLAARTSNSPLHIGARLDVRLYGVNRGAQIRTGDLTDPNGARYQAAPRPEDRVILGRGVCLL